MTAPSRPTRFSVFIPALADAAQSESNDKRKDRER
jgi:hypothetical protein